MKKQIDIPVTVNIDIDGIIIKSRLLDEIQHTLTTLTGLRAFDLYADSTHETDNQYCIDKEDVITLDFKELNEKIDKVLNNE